MSAVAESKKIIKGGSFLIEERSPEEIFTPEDFTEEHRMIADTTRQFIDNEVVTRIDELEKHDWKLARELVGKAADLGLIGANIPEEYGGLGLDQTSGALIGENIGRSASFATTLGAESGIGLLPIVYFATDAAKQWQGFGTALKPAVECWWLVRKPLSEKDRRCVAKPG